MLGSLNEHLHRSRVSDRFVAMSFGVFDANPRTLTLASAGFPRPWLVRDGRAEQLAIDGMALGLVPDASYRQVELALQPGDMIVLVSDGFDERMDERGEQFGHERLCASLLELARDDVGASAVATALMEATERHAPRSSNDDDRTLLVFKLA